MAKLLYDGKILRLLPRQLRKSLELQTSCMWKQTVGR